MELGVKQLTAEEVHARKVAELGLDPEAVDLSSVEGLAGALRRAASHLCPCAPRTLVREVVQPLRGLVADLDAVKGLVKSTLDAMTAHGDILEHRDVEAEQQRDAPGLLYAAPPSFVARESGVVLLLGVASDRASLLPEELESRIEYANHLRRLSPRRDEALCAHLAELGLVELSYDRWLSSPPEESAATLKARVDALLDASPPSLEVPGLRMLDPARPVRYYRERWVEPKSQSGRFVARRKQAYGADLWCYVQLRDGQSEHLVDLPLVGSRWRGCDEAWRLQLALDALREGWQRFEVVDGPRDTIVMKFFSPVPMWARRRWDAIGEPVTTSGCLFAYSLRAAEAPEELRFAREALWVRELE